MSKNGICHPSFVFAEEKNGRRVNVFRVRVYALSETQTTEHMKKILITIALAAITLQTNGQTKAEKITGPVVSEHNASYYSEQMKAWKKIVRQKPDNETAWRNYFLAAWYYERNGNASDSTLNHVLREMEESIPDTYTFYFANYRCKMGTLDCHQYAVEAMKRLPETMDYLDYDTWFCYSAMVGDEAKMESIAKKYYDSGLYSPAILQYSYNEMQGMEQGGIYIGNGDALVIPKWMLQYAKGLHKDKVIVCLPFLAIKQYREHLFAKLGVELPQFKEPKTQADYDDNVYTAVEALRIATKRPMYFSSCDAYEVTKPWSKKLYNEGLTLKYSEKSYDNFSVKRRNVEQNYMLEYLLESFTPNMWVSGNRFNLNYAVILNDLLHYYHKTDPVRYKWLHRILTAALDNSGIGEERIAHMKKIFP